MKKDRVFGWKKQWLLVLLTFCWLGAGAPVWGQLKPLYGLYNRFYGARSIGMANAFTAVADDLTAIFRNPAGVAELLVPQIYLDYRSDKLSYTYPTQTQDYTTYQEQYDYSFQASLKNLDFAAISAPVQFWDMQWSFALGYYRSVPYGIKGAAESRFVTNQTDGLNKTSTLQLAGSSGIDMLAVTGAFYLNEYFSFGVTLQRYFNTGSMALDFTTSDTSTLSYTREYTDKFKDTSLMLGLRFKMMEEIILGVSYQFGCAGPLVSQSTYQVKNSTSLPVTSQSEATLVIPAQYSVGLLLKPFKFMDLALDYSREYWGKATLTNYYGATTTLQYPVRDDYSFPQKDIINLRAGTQFNIPLKKANIFIRGGLFSDRQLFPDSSGASVRYKGFSLGLGLEIQPWVQLDAAYMRQKAVWQEAAYFAGADTIDTTSINKIFCVSFTFKFGMPPTPPKTMED